MRLYIILFFLFSTLFIYAQIEFDKTSHNFGSIEKDSKRWVDFTLTNHTNSHLYLMRANKDDDVDLIYTRGKIAKDSVAYIRVQINPKSIGPFNKKIELFVSTEQKPIELQIKGSINFFDPSNDPACPDFSTQKPAVNTELTLVIEVLDKTSNQPVKNATINISNPQLVIFNALSNKEGKSSFNTINGLHSVFVSAEDYIPVQISDAVTYRNNYITVILEKKAKKEVLVVENQSIDDKIDEYITDELSEEINSQKSKVEDPILIIETVEQPIIDTYQPSTTELSEKEYAPNNIVFLMDISNSMNKLDKLVLLKIAVKEMVGVMRSFDRIAIITYASSVDVILPSTSGAEKEKIYTLIDSLKAEGLTAGSSGIKTAYELAFTNFIEKANNQIILTTDGAFNVEEEGYNIKQEAFLNSLKGVTLSVVGVKTGRHYIEELKALSKKGRGKYIHIKNEKDAQQSLVEELKRNSKK